MLKAPMGLLSVLMVSAYLLSPQALAQDAQPDALWADFNHYVRIARPDMALAAGNRLLSTVNDQQLLDVVESSEYRDYEMTLQRAARTETLEDLSRQFRDRIQSARIARAREPQRIQADIRLLAEGARANANATQRLRAAGQYAAPALLSTLLNEAQEHLHPYVLGAMVNVGRPLVYPLAEALPYLEPVPQGQVAQVLAEIGYPRALPYIKLILEREDLDPNTRTIAQSAFDRLAETARIDDSISAAELYLTLGQNYYTAATLNEVLPGYDANDAQGIIWQYVRRAGLVAIPVPGEIFGDVLALRASEQALKLQPSMSPALSLWLMSNLRRENRLAKDANDPSYGRHMLPPRFYIEMAGPLRQHDVLHQALNDGDTQLALDAIAALSATAGTDALVNREGTVQPLVRALSYPDRRVRFAAAFAMANARPAAAFPGSYRVVSVLAEAVRQSDVRYALVLGRDQESVNRLSSAMNELGYQPIGGQSLNDVADPVNAGPGVDLIVTDKPLEEIQTLYHQTSDDYKLAAVPLLAVISAGDQIVFNQQFHGIDRLRAVLRSEQAEDLRGAVQQATAYYTGDPIDQDEAAQYATTSLQLLRDIALGASRDVYHIADAEPALIQALGDSRQAINVQAARVLAMIDSQAAQQAIAEVAIDQTRPEALRIALLESLAESATHHGSYLTQHQLDRLLSVVQESRGDLAIAAARTHGALTLPTANVVNLLLQHSGR